jgi:hypothetical protein
MVAKMLKHVNYKRGNAEKYGGRACPMFSVDSSFWR